jgi:hypothetical protein
MTEKEISQSSLDTIDEHLIFFWLEVNKNVAQASHKCRCIGWAVEVIEVS